MSLKHPTSPSAIIHALFSHAELILELIKRDFLGRYKGSFMGLAWSLFNPLLMLLVYALVFNTSFKTHLGAGQERPISFALVLFSGMIVHGLFAECLTRAPSLILGQPNYVKKVVFPLEILPLVVVVSAILHFLISLLLLLLVSVVSGIGFHLSIFLVPVVILPLILLSLGLTWLFASLGVYLRDLAQAIAPAVTALLFLSPVFYPVSSLPENFRFLFALNPITMPIDQMRDVMFWGIPIQWGDWGFSLLMSALFAWLGFWWFQISRKGFSDVI